MTLPQLCSECPWHHSEDTHLSWWTGARTPDTRTPATWSTKDAWFRGKELPPPPPSEIKKGRVLVKTDHAKGKWMTERKSLHHTHHFLEVFLFFVQVIKNLQTCTEIGEMNVQYRLHGELSWRKQGADLCVIPGWVFWEFLGVSDWLKYNYSGIYL